MQILLVFQTVSITALRILSKLYRSTKYRVNPHSYLLTEIIHFHILHVIDLQWYSPICYIYFSLIHLFQNNEISWQSQIENLLTPHKMYATTSNFIIVYLMYYFQNIFVRFHHFSERFCCIMFKFSAKC